MSREKWNLNPERWNRRQKTEGEAIAKVAVEGAMGLIREGGKALVAIKESDDAVKAEAFLLERTKVLAQERIGESENDMKVALDKAAKGAEKAKDKQITKREKNTKKYENQKTDIDQKWKTINRYFDHLERQDEMELTRLENGQAHSVAYIHGNSDAVVMSLMGIHPAPRQVAAAPQLPAIEMSQAAASANSKQDMVLRK